MSLSVSVDLVSFIACAIILSATYSIQAWFSGGLPFFLVEILNEGLGGRNLEGVAPGRRPSPGEVALARRPGVRGVEIEPDDRIRKAELGILLDQIGDLVAGQIAAEHVEFRLPHLQQIGAEVGHVGCDQFVADQITLIGAEEALRRAEQIVAEYIVAVSVKNFLSFTMLSRSRALPTALTMTVFGMSTWKVYLLQFLPRSASERAPICINSFLLRAATCMMVTAEA